MKRVILISVLILQFGVLSSQTVQTIFQKVFGKNSNDYFEDVARTSDGGFVLAGSQGNGANFYDAFVLKIDNNGDTLWSRSIGGTSWDYFNSVKECSNGDIMVVGTSDFYDIKYYDVYCARLTSSGAIIWRGGFGNSGMNMADYGEDFVEVENSNMLVLGTTEMGVGAGSGSVDIYLFKMNAAGTVLWTKTYGRALDDSGSSLLKAKDGTILIGATTADTTNSEIALINIDTLGNVIWSKKIGTGQGESFGGFLQNSAGEIMVVGTKTVPGDKEMIVFKTDSVGNMIWSKVIGGISDDQAYSIEPTPDGNYVITGTSASVGFGGSDAILMKIDNNGTILYAKAYGGTYYDEGKKVLQTNDDGFIIAGKSVTMVFGNADAFIIKTDRNGESGCDQLDVSFSVQNDTLRSNTISMIVSSGGGVAPHAVPTSTGTNEYIGCFDSHIIYLASVDENTAALNNIVCYPNPSSGEINFSNVEAGSVVTIVDVLGRQVCEAKAASGNLSVDLQENPKGIYFFRIMNEEKQVKQGKIILN